MALERSAAPTGYHWHEIPELKTSLLVPNGWHLRSARDRKALSNYFAREDFKHPVRPQVALSILVMPQLIDRVAADYAVEFIANVCNSRELVNALDDQMDLFVGNGCFREDEGTALYTLMVANPKTNTLYQFIFSAAELEWKTAWPIGEKMIRSIVLDHTL